MQCHHCGREVRETVHKQKSYRVDYYRLHTGQTEWDFFLNPKQDSAPIRYLKLTHPIDVYTCVACYDRTEVRRRLDDDFAGRRPLVEADLTGASKPGALAKG